MDMCRLCMVGGDVMPLNLALNLRDRGFRVALHNRTMPKIHAFLGTAGQGPGFAAAETPQAAVAMLAPPRVVMLLVKAGQAVDETIAKFVPHLSAGDVLVDGGNSNWGDTQRRFDALTAQGLLYIGTGVSGGEEGARHGPAIMPGGSDAAWPLVKDIFQAIAAKAGPEQAPCCDWVGPGGAGHFVKMVHNGIEYGDMQLIVEAYHLMKAVLRMGEFEIAKVFRNWNRGRLSSYLVEIAGTCLAEPDADGEPLVSKILDKAGAKGTGAWTVQNAAELGVPLPLIAEAVWARSVSAMRDERLAAAQVFSGPRVRFSGDPRGFIRDLRKALLAAKICSYAQGYMLMRAAAKKQGWPLNYGGVASIWRGGCIIRSVFLADIKAAFDSNPTLTNLLLDPYFAKVVQEAQSSWRRVVSTATMHGIPVPAFASALSFFAPISSRGSTTSNRMTARRSGTTRSGAARAAISRLGSTSPPSRPGPEAHV
jgi:6-phosphogluconate dehydrogenase